MKGMMADEGNPRAQSTLSGKEGKGNLLLLDLRLKFL